MSLIGQLQFVIITVCACAHSTLLPSKNLYVLHTCIVYAIVLRTCICVRYSLLYFNFCDSMYYYMYMYL